MKYRIKPSGSDNVKDVWLDEENGEVTLVVDDWAVATLTNDGKLRLCGGIIKDNGSGLKVNKAEQIVIER